jgi:DNA-binding PadR family transcriptional regulator
MKHRKLVSGFIRLHVLHHAAKAPIYGNWMMEELEEHGYKMSPGTMYPLLRGMEKDGYLISHREQSEGRIRQLYEATDLGREALRELKHRIKELFREIVKEEESELENRKDDVQPR